MLAERVRSELGPLVKGLDQPHVHVTSVDGVVSLHGEVTDDAARAAVEVAVRRMGGVTRVDSHLHTGLGRGDSTPSAGHRAQRSLLMQQLETGARDCGFFTIAEQRYVLQAVLGIFTARLPRTARRRFLEHLPHDVRALATPARWLGNDRATVMTGAAIAQVVGVAANTDRGAATRLLRHLLPLLRDHSPGDAAVVSAALPPELRKCWLADAPTAPDPRPDNQSSVHQCPGRQLPVSAVMTRNVVTIREDANWFDAFELLTHARVRHLPVIRMDGHCVAILDAESVAKRLPQAWVSRTSLPLHNPGTVGPLSVLADEPLSKAAQAMNAAGVDACCVVDVHGRLVGLLTARDFVAAVAGAYSHD